MNDNNFICSKVPKQIARFYVSGKILDKVTGITYHQDNGCPGCDVEISSLNRIDKWQWEKVSDDMNGWVKKLSEEIETEEIETEETKDQQGVESEISSSSL